MEGARKKVAYLALSHSIAFADILRLEDFKGCSSQSSSNHNKGTSVRAVALYPGKLYTHLLTTTKVTFQSVCFYIHSS